MGFAEGYLQKHAIGKPLIHAAPDPNIHTVIAIPAYNESGLHRCLDSLFSCTPPEAPVEVIVLINSATHTSPEIIGLNRKAYHEVKAWCGSHRRPGFTVHPVLLENLPCKHFGAGLARKLVMDEAVRRFNQVDRPSGILLSLDADTTVEQNYLQEVTSLFALQPETDGCSIRFAHPVGGGGERECGRVGERERGPDVYPDAVYDAIVNYELHQRYYIEAVRFTGYPYAFHTVGSAFAVRAGVYCRQGGMSKRQAGEDFYFIQKVAMQGQYSECNTTTVHPSPRPSDRVPFGTGPDIARQLEKPGEPYLTHAPELFQHLKAFYSLIPNMYALPTEQHGNVSTGRPAGRDRSDSTQDKPSNRSTHTQDKSSDRSDHMQDEPAGHSIRSLLSSLSPLLQSYLEATGFFSALAEVRGNVASETAFQQRFFRKFNMFWILKYLHFAGEKGTGKLEVGAAARAMLELTGTPITTAEHLDLLVRYRNIQADHP